MSADVGVVAETLIREESLQKVAFAGFSMGGNLILKLLGEWGTQAPPQIEAGIGVSPAMDLAASADALHDPANRIYEWRFLRGLRQRIRRKAALYPDRYDTRYICGVRSLRDFDDQVTARYCGFLDAQDYYTRAASAQFLDRIAVPTLVLHAADDPFIRVLPDTRDKLTRNPHITYLETANGGHCAFMAQANGYDGRWAERQAIAFLQRVERGESVSAPPWVQL
jgi:predicted alpha/beta-fold hydrolase